MADRLIAFARRVARETGKPVPTPNPRGPTTRALALFLLRDPGATATSGANETGILDPYMTCDLTSTRQRNALAKAGIDPRVCVWWNASPYHLGYTGKLRPEDVRMGASYLRRFVNQCPDLRVVVAMGDEARAVARRVWQDAGGQLPPLLLSWHPMTRGRGGAERQVELAADLQKAAKLIRG